MAVELFTQETQFSDNRFRFIMEHFYEEIIIGGSVTHVFELPFVYNEQIISGKIIYKQGLENIQIYNIISEMVVEDSANNRSFIKINLSPIETRKFKDSYLDTFSQLRLVTKTGEVIFDEPHPIVVKKPLYIEGLLEDNNGD